MGNNLRFNIKKRIVITAIMLLVFLVMLPVTSPAANYLSQYGITWTFDKELSTDGAGDTYQYGTFLTGDYWVVGPVNIVAIDPACGTLNGRLSNGSQVNPTNNWEQGYDEGAPWYNSAVNVGIGISSLNPLCLSAHSSLISSKGLYTPTSYTQLSDAAILTVLPESPVTDAFRPAYCGNDKSIRYTKSSLDYSVLKTLAPVTGTPGIESSEEDFERPRIDHAPIPHGQLVRPHYNYNERPYGREIARASLNAALLLNLNYTNAEKELLLTRYIQYGIDLFGITQTEGPGWRGDGGHSGGRKLPVFFAGKVLGDESMLALGEYCGLYLYTDPYGPGDQPPDYKDFGEDAQVFYVSDLEVEITHATWWAPDSRDEAIAYETSHIGLPEWSQTHSHAPKKCTNWWDAIYRDVAGCTFPGTAMAAHIMGLRSAWNNPAFFNYCDRYMSIITTNSLYAGWQSGTNGVGSFVMNLWQSYRSVYGCQWVPDDPADLYALGKIDCSRCLYNCSAISPDAAHVPGTDGDARCRVVPNPMTDVVAFDWEASGSVSFTGQYGTPLQLTIYGRDGHPLYRESARHGIPLRWDGTDFAGDRVPPGTYCFTMYIDGREVAGKILKTE